MVDDKSDSASVWEHARAYATLLGAVPSSFTTGIRNLKADADKGQAPSRATAFQATRLAGSPTLSVGFSYAVKFFMPEEAQKRGPQIGGKDFLELFPPETLAILIGVSYLYRRAKKSAAEDEWGHYSSGLHGRADVGGAVGLHIPRISLGKGVLVGALDTISLTCFHLHDKKGFTEYRRALKQKNLREDLKYEADRWGCTRYHVGSMLIQSFGMGVSFANAYANGLLSSDTDERLLDPDAYTFRIARVWIDSLMETGQEPSRPMRVEYYPEKAAMEKLQAIANRVRTQGSAYTWLDKTKEEVLEGVPGADAEA